MMHMGIEFPGQGYSVHSEKNMLFQLDFYFLRNTLLPS